MSQRQTESHLPETNSKKDPWLNLSNAIEGSILSMVDFAVCYIRTFWFLFRWSFKKTPCIVSEKEANVTGPYTFLFLSSSILYFSGERLSKFIEYLADSSDKPFEYFSNVSRSSFSLESFTYNTAPIIAIVFIFALLLGQIFGHEDKEACKKIQTFFCYMIGYFIIFIAISNFLLGPLTHAVLVVGFDQKLLVKGIAVSYSLLRSFSFLFMIVLIYSVINMLFLIYSSVLITFFLDHPRRLHKISFRYFAIVIFIASTFSLIIYVTNKNAFHHLTNPPWENALSGAAVINLLDETGNKRFNVCIAMTNKTTKPIAISPLFKMNMEIRTKTGKSIYETVHILSPDERLIVIDPERSISLLGELTDQERDGSWIYNKQDIKEAILSVTCMDMSGSNNSVYRLHIFGKNLIIRGKLTNSKNSKNTS